MTIMLNSNDNNEKFNENNHNPNEKLNPKLELAEKILFNLLEYLKESGQKNFTQGLLNKHIAPCLIHKEANCPLCTLKQLVLHIGTKLRIRQALTRRIQNVLFRLNNSSVKKILIDNNSGELDFNALNIENTKALLRYMETVDLISTQILELSGEKLQAFREEMLFPVLGENPESLIPDQKSGENSEFILLDFIRHYTRLGAEGLARYGSPEKLLESILLWSHFRVKLKEEAKDLGRSDNNASRLKIPLNELHLESNGD
jgi:hypothetical protein